MRSVIIAALTGLCLLSAAPTAFAHPVPFSYLDLRMQPAGGDIEGSLVAPIFDIAHDLNIAPPERLLDPAVVAERKDAIVELLSPRLALMADALLFVVDTARGLRLHFLLPEMFRGTVVTTTPPSAAV